MNYGQIKYYDIANGEGVRVSLFVSGCRNHCKGCFQPETWDFNYGKPFTREVQCMLYGEIASPHISGISILGGDPFEPENEKKLVPFLCKLKSAMPSKTVWVYTGYLYENLSHHEMMEYIDVLVDGKFEEDKKDISLAFRGSSNQRIIDVPASLRVGLPVELMR